MNEHKERKEKKVKEVLINKEAELVDTKVHVFNISFFNLNFCLPGFYACLKLYWTL